MVDFNPIIEKYGLTGTLSQFYEAGPDFVPSGTFADRYLIRDWLAGVNNAWLKLSEEPLEALIAAAEALAREDDLVLLCEYCRHLFFECASTPESLAALGCPVPRGPETAVNDFFGLIAHLSGIEIVRARYAERGIPESVMRASYQTVRIWMGAHLATFGRWGFTRAARGNPRMHHLGSLRLFRIGRLEFERNYFKGAVVGLQHRQTGKVRALLEGGTQLRGDGLINGTNEIYDPKARLCIHSETPEAFYAHPVRPHGRGAGEPARFPEDEWRVILRRGYAVLNLHIPRDGRMDIDACREALASAREFFPRYFPEHSFTALVCHTWLFDDQFRELLSPTSNIVRFGELFHCFPEKSDDAGIYAGVFDEKRIDIGSFKPTTSLERAIVNHYKQGGRLHAAGGFIPF